MSTSKAIRVAVTGVAGRMGQTLVRMVREDEALALVGATERAGSSAVGLDVGLVTRLGAFEIAVSEGLEAVVAAAKPDVVIDFTSAEASVEHARVCARSGVALVVGSTGFSAEAKAAVAECARSVPVVMSPNMSVGVNLVIRMASELARVLGDAFDVEIVEVHHRQKKDAPSGTALRMAEDIARVTGRPSSSLRTTRVGQAQERTPGEIGVQAVRGGDVVGEHTVFFLGEGERVELTHRATSRDQFGRGAVRAARWVAGRPAGLYDMQDVLGLKGR